MQDDGFTTAGTGAGTTTSRGVATPLAERLLARQGPAPRMRRRCGETVSHRHVGVRNSRCVVVPGRPTPLLKRLARHKLALDSSGLRVRAGGAP